MPGSRGIGAAITSLLAKGGAKVAAGYSRDTAAAEKLRSELGDAGQNVSLHQGRVDDADDCNRRHRNTDVNHRCDRAHGRESRQPPEFLGKSRLHQKGFRAVTTQRIPRGNVTARAMASSSDITA